MIDYIKQFRKEFKNRLPLPTSHYGELQKDLESFLSQALTRIEEAALASLRIGDLRLWLNEDRITDKKMVTDEEIRFMLGITPSDEKEERYYWDVCPHCGRGHSDKFDCQSPKKEGKKRKQ